MDDIIRAEVSPQQYAQCWRGYRNPPSFETFFASLSTRINGILPPDYSELQIELYPSTSNRISIGGSFVTEGSVLSIFGQIVWVPKHKFFRGKLGTRKPKLERIPPEDLSTQYEYVPNGIPPANGFKVSFWAEPRLLVERFGQPGEADGFKKSGMFVFKGNGGSTFLIYDWEATTAYWDCENHPDVPSPSEFWSSDAPYEFRLSGTADSEKFVEWITEELDRKP